MAPNPSKSSEILSGSPDEKIIIKSVEDFKSKLNLNSLPEGELKEFFDEPIETTRSELVDLRKKYLEGEPSLSTVKNFLETSRNAVLEASKEGFEKIKGNLEQFAKYEKQKIKDGKIDGAKIEEETDKALESLNETGGDIKDKAKKLSTQAGGVIKKGTEAVKGFQFISVLEKAEKDGGFLGFLAGILLGILNFRGIGKGVEKLDNILSPEEITKTKEKVKGFVVENLGDTLTKENISRLESSLDKLTKEEISSLGKKIKSGTFNLSDLGNIAPNIFKSFLEKEQIEKIKYNFEQKLLFSIKKEIANKYSINLEGTKLNELKELIKENSTISDESIGVFVDASNNKEFKFKDLFGPTFETIINSSSLIIGLISKQIIPLSAFGANFVDASGKLIQISVSAIGISENINIDTFNKTIENFSEKEKATFIGLLYRKGGLLFSITGSLLGTATKITSGFLTNTSAGTYDLLSASLKYDYPKQIENLNKISKSLGGYNEIDTVLKEAAKSIELVTENYKILDILSKSEGKTSVAIQLLEEAGISKNRIPNPNLSFDEFVKVFKNSASTKLTDFGKGAITSAIGFGASADLHNFNKRIESITSAQRKMFEGNFLTKGIGKIRELSNIGEISRLGDRITLHYESIDAAKKGISKWNILANKFPDLVKGVFDKLPIIAVAGISANSDKPFFEELKNQMPYLIPILGPILIIGDSGISWKNMDLESINAVEAGIGGALLTLDGVFVIKEFSKGIGSGLSYLVKPLKDTYSIIRGTSEGAYSIGKAALKGKSFNGIISKSIERSKAIKKPKLRAIAILAGIGYLGIKTTFSDSAIDEIFGEEGVMNKEQLKNEISNLNDSEKLICLKYLVTEAYGLNSTKDITFEINNNSLNIVSVNDQVKGNWIIDDEMLKLLNLNPNPTFTYNKNPA